MTRQFIIAPSEVWHRLSTYESTDSVRTYFKLRHGRELNAGKAREIASHFAQAREYFRSASLSSEAVRPLLQYYGVLSLTRGFIIFLSPIHRESSLAQSHGLSAKDWHGTLSKGLENIINLRVKSEGGGTFSQLLETLGNKSYSRIILAPYPNRVLLSVNRPESKIFDITLDDLISRIPELIRVYEETFMRHSNCFSGTFFTLPNDEDLSIMHVFRSEFGLPREDYLRSSLKIPVEATSSTGTEYLGITTKAPNTSFTYNKNARKLHYDLPIIQGDIRGNDFIISDFPDGNKMGYMPKLFILSYFMGMLVRYNPTYWLSLTSRQGGDKLYPLLRLASDLIQEAYPMTVLSRMDKLFSDSK